MEVKIKFKHEEHQTVHDGIEYHKPGDEVDFRKLKPDFVRSCIKAECVDLVGSDQDVETLMKTLFPGRPV